MTTLFIESIGIAAGVIGVLAWGPQITEVWKHKRHDGISLPTFSIVAFSSIPLVNLRYCNKIYSNDFCKHTHFICYFNHNYWSN